MNVFLFLPAFLVLLAIGTKTADGNRMEESLGLFALAHLHTFIFNNHSARHNRSINHAPTAPHNLVEGDNDVILFSVGGADPIQIFDESTLSDFAVEEIIAVSRNPRVAKVINATFSFSGGNSSIGTIDPSALFNSDGTLDIALNVHVRGHTIGKTVIDISVIGYRTSDNGSESLLFGIGQPRRASKTRESRVFGSFDIAVVRKSLYKTLGYVFTVCVAAMYVFTTFLIGTKLDWRIILKQIKKPASLLIGLGLECLVMPLIAFGWAVLILGGNYGWELVYLAIGACPGGGHSPFWTMMLDGNLDLAVAMSFVASIAALGVLPFWLFTIGRTFYAGHFNLPFHTIAASLCGLICPIFLGILLKHYYPLWADRIGKIVKHVTVVSFIISAVFGCAVNSYVFYLLDWRHLMCGLLLPWCGYAIAYPLSRWIFRRTHEDSIAIAVENGCLNVAIPTVLLQLTLAQPDADLSLVIPVGVVIFAPWPLWIYFIALTIRKRMTMPVVPLQIPSPGNNGEKSRRGSSENVQAVVIHRKSRDNTASDPDIALTTAGDRWPETLPACVNSAQHVSTQMGDKKPETVHVHLD